MGKVATSALFCEIRAERGRVEFQPHGARVRVQWRLMRVRPPGTPRVAMAKDFTPCEE